MERKALAKFPSFSWIDFAILPNASSSISSF